MEPTSKSPRKGTEFVFQSPYSQHADRIGQRAVVERVIRKPDAEHDAEVLPMYVARFPDGAVIECWPEEVSA